MEVIQVISANAHNLLQFPVFPKANFLELLRLQMCLPVVMSQLPTVADAGMH